MPFRVAAKDKNPELFNTGRHVLVDASGAGAGNYCMAAVCLENGLVTAMLSSPCREVTSVNAEREAIEWAMQICPGAKVWNDCIPAIEAMLQNRPETRGLVFWPTPRMRKPFHDMAHELSVRARGLARPACWLLEEGSGSALADRRVGPFHNRFRIHTPG